MFFFSTFVFYSSIIHNEHEHECQVYDAGTKEMRFGPNNAQVALFGLWYISFFLHSSFDLSILLLALSTTNANVRFTMQETKEMGSSLWYVTVCFFLHLLTNIYCF